MTAACPGFSATYEELRITQDIAGARSGNHWSTFLCLKGGAGQLLKGKSGKLCGAISPRRAKYAENFCAVAAPIAAGNSASAWVYAHQLQDLL